MQIPWQQVTALHFEPFLLSNGSTLHTQRQEQCVRGLDLSAATSFTGLCLFALNTETVLSAVGLFVPPTISSLIASPNREAGQYFRANVLCKSCHSFPSLEWVYLGLVYQNEAR